MAVMLTACLRVYRNDCLCNASGTSFLSNTHSLHDEYSESVSLLELSNMDPVYESSKYCFLKQLSLIRLFSNNVDYSSAQGNERRVYQTSEGPVIR